MKRTPTSKLTLIVIVIAVLAIVAFIFLHYSVNRSSLPATIPESVTVPTQWPSVKLSDQTESDSGTNYSIKAVYPVVKDAAISADFKNFIDTSVSQFKSDNLPANDGDVSLNITYTEQKNTIADNYIFSTDEYSGGAHDLVSTQTFSFAPSGQEITLDTLFSNGANGLTTIAPYVVTQLTNNIPGDDPTMIAAGTAPTEANYQNFTVQADGITFIFDPYEVAPYSDGEQTVTVPLSAFKSIANTTIFSQ